MTCRVNGLAMLLGPALLAVAWPCAAVRDVMLVLDNSGSMRQNDPDRLGVAAVEQFIRVQPFDTRVGILLYDTASAVVLPLDASDQDAASRLRESLARLTYSGQWTQTAAAIERALYALREQGRADAQQAIVLVTDGLIDTGDPALDVESRRWLLEELASQAEMEGVRVFGIAFTEQADFMLLQALASRTGGEYFRARTTEDLREAWQRIDRVLRPAESSPVPRKVEPSPADSVGSARAAADASNDQAVAGQAKPTVDEADTRTGLPTLVWMLLAVIGAAVAVLLWLFRGHLPGIGSGRDGAAKGPLAVLYDLSTPASPVLHEIGERPVVIGRKPGTDPSREYVVIEEKTVGRWHATIERRGQTFYLRDEASANGTFINGERIKGERPLRHGDAIRIHKHPFEFVIPDLMNSDKTMMSPVPLGESS